MTESELLPNRIKIGSLQKVSAMLFSFILVFASMEIYKADESTIIINKIFMKGVFHERFFSLFQLSFLGMVVLLSWQYKLQSINLTKTFLYFSVFITICYIFNMINPNNKSHNPVLGMPLLSNWDEYLLLVLVYTYSLWNRNDFAEFLKLIFTYITFFLVIRGVYLLTMWTLGMGQKGFFGINATVTESDSLYIYSFFQLLIFGVYLALKKFKYLVISLFFLLIIILSFRRTFTFISLIGSLLLLGTHFLQYLKKCKAYFSFQVFLVLLIIGYNFLQNIDINYNNKYILRFLSALPDSKFSGKSKEFSDSGHWDQTYNTTVNFFQSNSSFWGTGYGQGKELVVEGQSSSIHNIFVSSWAYVGFHLFLLVLILFLFSIVSIIIYFFKNLFSEKFERKVYFLQLTISLMLFLYFVAMMFSSIYFLNRFKMEFFWITLFSINIKLNFKNWEQLLNYKFF